MKERIVELDMVKGFFILCVIFDHAISFTGLKGLYKDITQYMVSFFLFAMAAFFILSGYTYGQGKLNVRETILKRIKSMLLPYYGYAIPMIAVLFIVYMLCEKCTMEWFVDG